MENNVLSRKKTNSFRLTDNVLKATALVYLKEALFRQKYEQCAELIRSAKEFGAGEEEVRGVIEEYVRELKGGSREEPYNQYANRLDGY